MVVAKPQPRLRRHKKALFGVALILLAVGSIELMAFAALSFISNDLVSHADLSTNREQVALTYESPTKQPNLPERFRRGLERPQVIHPYLGFIMDASRYDVALDGRHDGNAADFGFPHNTDPLFQEPSDQRFIIGIFGGSVARLFAESESGSELKRLFRSVPRFADREPMLLCLALSGYKQPQQLMSLNYFLSLGAHFDVVINIDGVNEVAHPVMDLVPKEIFPFYPYGWYWRTARLDPDSRRTVGALTCLRDIRARQAIFFSHSPLRYSMAAGLIWTIADRVIETEISKWKLRMVDGSNVAKSFQSRGPRRNYSSSEELFRDIAAVWRRSSLQMHVLCTGRGIEYYHFLQPNQYVEGSKPLSRIERRRAWDAESRWRPGIEAGYPHLLKAGAELHSEGVRFYDLTQIFADVREPLYFDTCCHFNKRGNMILAAEIARIITRG